MEALAQLSRRRRSSDQLCDRAQCRSVSNDKTYANQLKGIALLEPIFKRQPPSRHRALSDPFYDYPALAESSTRPGAMPRLRRLRRTAHAFHVFTRVGYWKVIASNRRVGSHGEPARIPRSTARDGLSGLRPSSARARQGGRAVVDEMIDVKGYNPNVRTGPMRLRRGGALHARAQRLERAAALRVQPTQFAICRCGHAFHARWERPLRQSGRRHRGYRQLAELRKSYGRPAAAIGRSRPISSGDRDRLAAAGPGQQAEALAR